MSKILASDEAKKLYFRRIQFLRNNIPPDDIYEFAEQALSCADFFLQRWNEWIDIDQECENDRRIHQWVHNLVGLRVLEKKGYKEGINIQEYLPDDLM